MAEAMETRYRWDLEKVRLYCEETLDLALDRERAEQELLALENGDYRWQNILINITLPAGHEFLQSCRAQVVSWLNQAPEDREYPSPLSPKQMEICHGWRWRVRPDEKRLLTVVSLLVGVLALFGGMALQGLNAPMWIVVILYLVGLAGLAGMLYLSEEM